MKQNLIFIHGFRGNHLGLLELASRYFDEQDFKVYTPDLPPAGGQSLKEYTPDTYADFVASYIKKNHIKKPVLIGHSMGSIIAAATAAKYPELLNDKIIFLAPISIKPSAFFASLVPLTAFLPDRLVTYVSTKYLLIPKDKDLLKSTLITSYLCGADYTTKADVKKSGEFSSRYAISDFDFAQKACFIDGESDKMIPKSATISIAQKYHARTIFIKNSGHLLNYERPAETTAAIKNFLKD